MKKIIVFITLLLLSFSFIPITAQAASQDECAIWLCLPTGFGQGCGGAKSAFKHRIKRGKSPLPFFGSCSSDNSNNANMVAKDGVVAVIPEHTQCVEWQRQGSNHNRVCIQTETIPERLVKNTRCRPRSTHHSESPTGCTHTLNYTETYMDGVKYGETFYW